MYDMLSFAIQDQCAIEDITSEWKNNLWQFELTEAEWEIASELSDVLKVHVTCDTYGTLSLLMFSKILKDATLYFSRGIPNLPTVIPTMDHIDTYFTNMIQPSAGMNPAIRGVMAIAKKTLNCYYSLRDESEMN